MLRSLYIFTDNLEEATKYEQLIQELTPEPTEDEALAKPMIRVAPQYPIRAAKNGLEGEVTLSFTVDIQGHTKNVKVIRSSNKLFNKSAIRAAQKFRYEPPLKDGQPYEIHGMENTILYELAN